jgi:hypothetical protein
LEHSDGLLRFVAKVSESPVLKRICPNFHIHLHMRVGFLREEQTGET